MASLKQHLCTTAAYVELIGTLIKTGGTNKQLVEACGLGFLPVRKMILALHRRGLIRVVLWVEDSIGRKRIPVYAWGSGPDATKPPAMSPEERKQRYEAKRQEIADELGTSKRNVRLRNL